MGRSESSTSDVWSYGIVMYEIFTKCINIPYFGLNNKQVTRKVTIEHSHLDRPDECLEQAFDIMCSCWRFNPVARLACSSIFEALKNIMIPQIICPTFPVATSNDHNDRETYLDIDPFINKQDIIYNGEEMEHTQDKDIMYEQNDYGVLYEE